VSRALTGIDGGGQSEAYVSRVEMARRLGVHVSTIDAMVRNSEIPSVTWGRRTRRFLPSAVIRALTTRDTNGEAA
jgi:excisionase family DNA binding protein